MRANGVFQQSANARNRGGEILWTLRIARGCAAARVPPRPRAGGAAAIRNMEQQPVAGWQGKNVFDQSYRLRDAAEEQVSCQRIRGKRAAHSAGSQQRAKFGRKRETLVRLRIIKWFDSQGIASQKDHWHGGEMLAQIQ